VGFPERRKRWVWLSYVPFVRRTGRTWAYVAVVALVWLLGPGAVWVLHHWDGVHGLVGKDRAAAVDAVRGRVLAIATGILAIVAVYYTARNAHTSGKGM
jgi:hypothetical protein